VTKQEEEVVSFAATPKGFVREVREEEKEKETPKDEVKPEPSARKLGSSNRSFVTVLGALSAMIIGGALATYSISFEYALYLHEKTVSYFPWSWIHVYIGTSAATLELFLIGIAASSAIIFVGMMLLSKKKKTVVPDRAGDPQKQNQSKEVVVIVPEPLPTEVPETTVPKNVYQDNSFDELIAMSDASQERAHEMDATVKQVRADQKWERDHALEIQNEIWRRIHALGIKEPVQQPSAPPAHVKEVTPPRKVVTPPPPPKPRKEKNSGKANGKESDLKEALHEQGEMEAQVA